MIEQRDIAVCIILTIVTCGIYGLYWIYCLNEDTNTLAHRPEDLSGGLVIILYLVTCGIYGWYWMYQQGSKIDQIKASRGLATNGNGILYLLLAVFGLAIVSYALMQNELNNLSSDINNTRAY